MNKSNWLNGKELRDRFGISKSTPRQWVKRGKISKENYFYRKPESNASRELVINPMALDDKYKEEYIRQESKNNPDPHIKDIDAEIYAGLKDFQKDYVDLWLNLFDMFGHLKGKQLEQALAIYKDENPGTKGLSYKNFRKIKNAYDDFGLTPKGGLAPDYGKSEGRSIIEYHDFQLFKSYYLKESRPNLHSCWELVRGAAYEAGRDVSDFPRPITFKRRLEKNVPESAIYMARQGKAAWKKKYANYADRDKSTIPAGSCWVSDHRQLDVFVKDPQTGKLYRPWLTVWMDFKTGKWLSWSLHKEAPNSDHLFMTFKWAVEKFGKPEDIYIDNGKDYRAKDFAGGRSHHKLEVDETRCRSLMVMMGVNVHFAIPYNAQAKNIERAFRNFIEYLEKHLVGYTGSTAQDRPEQTKQRAKKGEAIGANTLDEMFDRFIEKVLNRKTSQGKEHKGLSPNELFFKEFTEKQVPRPESLKVFCMRTSGDVTIMRNGALDSSIGHRYWADWMAGMKGTKVYMRRDIQKYDEAWVFDAKTDEFIGKAYMDITINGLVESDVDRQQLRDKQAQKKREKKAMKTYFKHLERPSAEKTLHHAIANQDAEEEIRKARGDFVEYDENVKINRITDTPADEIVEKERKMRKTGTGDIDDIAPEEKKKSNLNSIWDE